MTQVRRGRVSRSLVPIAWLNDYPNQHAWTALPWLRRYWQGASERARQLGYRLEPLWVAAPAHAPCTAARYADILRARGINGLILPLLTRMELAVEPWQGFAVCMLGQGESLLARRMGSHSIKLPHHSVCHDAYHNAGVALDALRKLGYTRIGLITSTWIDRSENGYSRARLSREFLDSGLQLPILVVDRITPEDVPRNFVRWLRREKPEALIVHFDDAIHWLEVLGWQIPRDIAVAHLNYDHRLPQISGVNVHAHTIAATAVDQVASLIQCGEFAPPAIPHRTLVPGDWVEATSTPLKARSQPAPLAKKAARCKRNRLF